MQENQPVDTQWNLNFVSPGNTASVSDGEESVASEGSTITIETPSTVRTVTTNVASAVPPSSPSVVGIHTLALTETPPDKRKKTRKICQVSVCAQKRNKRAK